MVHSLKEVVEGLMTDIKVPLEVVLVTAADLQEVEMTIIIPQVVVICIKLEIQGHLGTKGVQGPPPTKTEVTGKLLEVLDMVPKVETEITVVITILQALQTITIQVLTIGTIGIGKEIVSTPIKEMTRMIAEAAVSTTNLGRVTMVVVALI